MIWRRTKLDTLGDIQVFLRAVSKHGKVHPEIKIQKMGAALKPCHLPVNCHKLSYKLGTNIPERLYSSRNITYVNIAKGTADPGVDCFDQFCIFCTFCIFCMFCIFCKQIVQIAKGR